MEKNIGFLTFEQFHGKQNIGSSRIRCKWLLPFWPEAEEFLMGRKYDVIVFQKAYWLEYIREFEGIKILDMCDADFLHWGYRIKQVVDECDAVTTSTMALATYMTKLTDKPVWCIPDRLLIDSFGDLKKDHSGRGRAKIAAWYGYSENFPMLDSSVNALVKAGIEDLIVISSKRRPYQLPAALQGKIRLTNYPWSEETVNDDLLRADIVLNPRSEKGRWKYKSNNKTVNAWALGLPVAHNPEELHAFMEEDARVAEGEMRYLEVRREYDVKKSVQEYKDLIDEIKRNKNA